jgi:hypothetical protein
VWVILGISNIQPDCFEAGVVIDVTTAAAFRPPVFAEISQRNAVSDVTLFQTPGTPGLKLSPHYVWMQIPVEDDMQVI